MSRLILLALLCWLSHSAHAQTTEQPKGPPSLILQSFYGTDNLGSNMGGLLVISPAHGTFLVKIGDVCVVDLYGKIPALTAVKTIGGKPWELAAGIDASASAPIVEWEVASLTSSIGPQGSLFGPFGSRIQFYLAVKPLAWGKNWKFGQERVMFGAALANLAWEPLPKAFPGCQLSGSFLFDAVSNWDAQSVLNGDWLRIASFGVSFPLK